MSLINNRGAINLEQRNGNLHIKVHGRFGVDTAMELTSGIARTYRTGSNVFIHTSDITAVSPQSREMFKSMLGVYNLPQNNIYLIGEKGFDICHDKGRVIIRKKADPGKRCGGRCKTCKCKTKQIQS